jgi:hypothetical protein
MAFALIAYLAIYLLVLALAGTIVLTCIPRFRVNVANVSLFVVGAIIGWVATLLPVEHVARRIRPSSTWASVAIWTVLLAGPIAWGVGIVALKTKFSATAQKTK